MISKNIPQEDLEMLDSFVRQVLNSPAYFEYRQHELKQAPTLSIMQKAQRIWDLVCELNHELENRDRGHAKKKNGQLESLLGRVQERDYPHLQLVLQKAWEIVDLAKDLIEQDSLKPPRPGKG